MAGAVRPIFEIFRGAGFLTRLGTESRLTRHVSPERGIDNNLKYDASVGFAESERLLPHVGASPSDSNDGPRAYWIGAQQVTCLGIDEPLTYAEQPGIVRNRASRQDAWGTT